MADQEKRTPNMKQFRQWTNNTNFLRQNHNESARILENLGEARRIFGESSEDPYE